MNMPFYRWLTVAALCTGSLLAQGSEQDQLLATLAGNKPAAEKVLAFKRLAQIGDARAVAAVAPYLADAQLASWSRIALESIPGPAADDVLRDAMDRVHGMLLVGVINSIGVR